MGMTKAQERARRSRHKWRSWYGTKQWAIIKARVKRDQPICAICKRRPTTIVDHVEPHRGDRVKFFSGPFQGLCKRCHDSGKQAREKRGNKKIGKDGWPIN